MSEKQSHKGIYIDLDTLLDLRMSTIISNDKELGKKIIENGSYANRICDEFGYMGIDVYDVIKRYTSKDKIIKNAFITDIYEFLMMHISSIKNNRALNNSGMIIMTINTFPYRIRKDKLDKLLTFFNTLLPMKNFFIDSICIDPNKISMSKADSEYFSLFMYYGMEWLKNSLLINGKQTAPDLNLFIPALLDNSLKLKTNEDYENLFKNLEDASRMTIKLNFLEIKKYNLKI